jgi:hypothetical protein
MYRVPTIGRQVTMMITSALMGVSIVRTPNLIRTLLALTRNVLIVCVFNC